MVTEYALSVAKFCEKHRRVLLIAGAALVVAFMSWQAFAVTATVTWVNPTANSNGTVIPATGAGSLTQTRVEWGTCSGTAFGVKAGEVVVLAPGVSAAIPGFADGQVACFRAYAKNTYLLESAASNVVPKSFPAPTPNPPVLGSTITVAYDIKMNSNGEILLGRAVGEMPLGTPCVDNDLQTNRGTYYPVRRADVTITRRPRSALIVTQCAWIS
jgi:hypothetical protein